VGSVLGYTQALLGWMSGWWGVKEPSEGVGVYGLFILFVD